MGRRTSKLATMFVASALIAGCTHYSAIPLNMVELRDEGREGFTISTEEAEGTDFGRVRGNGRTWLFGDCRPAAETAMSEMIQRARERGGTRIVDLKFRGKWAWKTAPLCRRNLTYVVFVLPLFVPWPAPVTVSGVAQ